MQTSYHNDKWVSKLCYLSDIFEKLNDLNLFHQGQNCEIFISNVRIGKITKMISILKSRVENFAWNIFQCQPFYSLENSWKNFYRKVTADNIHNARK